MGLEVLIPKANEGWRVIARGIAERWVESSLPDLRSSVIEDVIVLISRVYGEVVFEGA